ncbi:VOC family protein [Pinibacter aurantiacus]|uniref:VOC family protein n=1 Tax=Pinibacter aurantiacus TaxID=2851599 RepID=A0A9E2S5B3_9BACT|nr:VOC family protein [Pinibacter aurantiacus]MBV4355543.1 VOC family protein [Pinibacter aurantiacus]
MQQRLSFLTIGVNDLEQVKGFYIEKFGWQPMKDSDGIVFFKLNGFILGLYPANELAEDIGVPQDGSGFKRITMAVNFASEKEIDDVFAELEQKGVRIVKRPAKVFWGGYSGYVADIENNYWEFAFNPFLSMDENGSVSEHE